jgi:predicted transcriptional regulator
MSTTTEESSSVRIVTTPMPVPLADAVRELAELDDRSMASLVRQAVREYVSERRLVDAALTEAED